MNHMINPRIGLAAVTLAVGAGAVVFLSTFSPQAGGNVPALGPVPVVPSPVGLPAPVEPVRLVPAAAPPLSTVPSPTTSARQAAPKVGKSAGRTAPAPTKARQAPESLSIPEPIQQQPQPTGTDPNGSGGWQLPVCYKESCVAQPETRSAQQGAGTQSLNSTLGQLPIVGTIADLIGGR